jgi:hypothetical protein
MKSKGEKRFSNFVLMIGDEVVHEIQQNLNDSESKELKENSRDEAIVSLMKVAVVKTMINLQTKHAYNENFMETMLGTEDIEDK